MTVYSFLNNPVLLFISGISSDNERRILQTALPQVKKGEAKEAGVAKGEGSTIPCLVPVEGSFRKAN